jgi:hypothetical protein
VTITTILATVAIAAVGGVTSFLSLVPQDAKAIVVSFRHYYFGEC